MADRRGMPILPVEAYTSQEWFDREQERIFSRTWACAGLAEDIAEPGQYVKEWVRRSYQSKASLW